MNTANPTAIETDQKYLDTLEYGIDTLLTICEVLPEPMIIELPAKNTQGFPISWALLNDGICANLADILTTLEVSPFTGTRVKNAIAIVSNAAMSWPDCKLDHPGMHPIVPDTTNYHYLARS